MTDVHPTDGSDLAFPLNQNCGSDIGLTKREYFAAKIMAALLVGVDHPEGRDVELGIAASDAVNAADELVKALNAEEVVEK